LIERRKEKMLRLWNQKGKVVKNWRSRAWSIDPNKTNLTIIRAEPKLETIDKTDLNLNLNMNYPQLIETYPQYFMAIADMEQFG
jgi:hypothetical protein